MEISKLYAISTADLTSMPRACDFAHQVEWSMPSSHPEQMLFDTYPHLAYLLFEATRTFVVMAGFEPDEVEEWATFIEENGFCPPEFSTYDCMDERVGKVVQYYRTKHL